MLKDEILAILSNGDYCKVSEIKKGFEIKYGREYESPELSFNTLMALSKLFDTEEIDVDNYADSGCETCDYGSDYGHEIQIYNPKKNAKELKALVGKDLKE